VSTTLRGAPRESLEFRGERLRLPVYLDHQATTPLDPRVLEAMMPWLGERFGNPHSRHHRLGFEAAEAVERARGQVAALVGALPEDIVFTSGATESNNTALRGLVPGGAARGAHVVTCATEHPCVLAAARALERAGAGLTLLPVDAAGLVEPDALAASLRDDTTLVSVMAANNETGVLQPVEAIGARCRARGVPFHTDAAQAAGKVPVDVGRAHADLLSLSGHKLHGPKGIGALYARREIRARLQPLILGGGQERGLRSGTLPVALCVGLGAACEIARAEMAEEGARLRRLRDRLHARLRERLPEIALNGHPERRLPGNLNLRFPGLDAEEIMLEASEIALSTASACTTESREPSHVLRALGLDDEAIQGSLRIGLGRFTTEAEVDFAAERLAGAVERLRAEP